MRLLLTAVVPGDGRTVDVAAEVEVEACVEDLARELARLLGPVPLTVQVGGLLGDVERGSGARVLAEPDDELDPPPPTLWLATERLDPDLPLADSPVRHGVVLGVGGPLPNVLAEPAGPVELRIASGRDAGRVHRLPIGSVAVGSGSQCPVRLDDPTVPEVAVWVEVAPGGAVTVRPQDDAVATPRRPPARQWPLPGPVILPRPPEAPRRGPLASLTAFSQNGFSHHSLPQNGFSQNGRRSEGRAQLSGGPAHQAIDPQAELPLVHLARRPLDEARPWQPGEPLVVGDTLLELASTEDPDTVVVPSPQGATLDFRRPAARGLDGRSTAFTLPAAPWRGGVPGTGQDRRNGRRENGHQEAGHYRRRLRRIREQAVEALLNEPQQRRAAEPDPAAALLIATGPRARLWERRPGDDDWLRLRFGTGDALSRVSLRDPDVPEPLTWTAPDVPICLDVADAGVVGLAGPGCRALARWALAQAAVLHSPVDLELAVLSGPAGEADWAWLRWLPHARVEEPGPIARVGADDATVAARLAELAGLVRARQALQKQARGAAAGHTLLVVLDGIGRLRGSPDMLSLLREGPAVGVHFLCLDDDPAELPEPCRAVVLHDGRYAEVHQVDRLAVERVRPDEVSPAWCERIARALAPLRDASPDGLDGALPASSRLLDVLGLDRPDATAIARRWAAEGRTTQAVIGEGVDGPFVVDLDVDGPHTLVAGATGSGKSELLRTMIASLAVGNRPDELVFVLIDHGGGKAFGGCEDLPHTVAVMTELDGHLGTRILASLNSELDRRERWLARLERSGTSSLQGSPDEPMPRLLIVVDEIAGLVAERPDFVAGLVDIAHRGSNLGVHLVAATRRPSSLLGTRVGSVATLRIALRLNDTQDSRDVIGSDAATRIPRLLPGRGYVRLESGSLAGFQVASVSGRSRGGGNQPVTLRSLAWDRLGHGSAPTRRGTGEPQLSDLAALVTAITEAAEADGVGPSTSPWLPPLPDVVSLDLMLRLAGDPRPGLISGQVAPTVFGMTDLPAGRRRGVAVFDVRGAKNLCVLGPPGSGRSSVLRTIAGSVAVACHPRDVHLYGVDCAGNALLPLLELPHTGAVVGADQPDRLARLTHRLLAEITRRQHLLAEHEYTHLAQQRSQAEPEQRLPYLLVLLDGWEGLVSALDSIGAAWLVEEWLQILATGPRLGIVMVVTAGRGKQADTVAGFIDDRLLLRVSDDETPVPAGEQRPDLQLIGLPANRVPRHMPPGRGFRVDGARQRQAAWLGPDPSPTQAGVLETQVALLDPDSSGAAQVAALQSLGRESAVRVGIIPAALRPFRVDQLPTRITLSQALDLADRPARTGELPIAVGGDALALRYLDAARHRPGLLIAGPRRTGRSTALRVLAEGALQRGWQVGVVLTRRSPLRDLAGRDGVAGLWLPESDPDEVALGLRTLRAAEGSPPCLVVLDDVDQPGLEGHLADLVEEHIAGTADGAGAVAASGITGELAGIRHGLVPKLARSGLGLLLAPRSASDGELFGARLPWTVAGSGPRGRGMLLRSGTWEPVQVPLP